MKTEIQKNQPFALCKERSYVNCLVQGLRLGVENVWALWRNLWPWLVAAVVMPLPFGLIVPGALAVELQAWPVQGFVPAASVRGEWPRVWATTKRYLVYVGLSLLFVLLCQGALVGLGLAGVPVWVLALMVVAMLVLYVPLEWLKLEMLFGTVPAGKCLSCYADGLRHLGRLVPFSVLQWLLATVVSLLASTPFVVALLVIGQRAEALAVGDAAVVPLGFWVLTGVSGLLLMGVGVYLLLVLIHAQMLLWGSITATERARRSVEEIPADAEAES